MNRIIVLLALSIGFSADAQNLRKGLKNLMNNEVADATQIFQEGILAYPACPASNYGLAVIEVEKKPSPDLFQAFVYIRKAVNSSSDFVSKRDYTRLDEFVNQGIVYNYFEKIDLLLLNQLRKNNSIPELERHLRDCGESDHTQVVMALRDSLEFNEAQRIHTISGYDTYIRRFPRSRQRGLAVGARNRLHYEAAVAINTIPAYRKFISEFPDAAEVSLAQQACVRLAFNSAKALNTVAAYQGFLSEYPESDLSHEARNRIMELDFEAARASHTAGGYRRFLKEYPNSSKEKEVRKWLVSLEFRRVMELSQFQELRSFKAEFTDAPVSMMQSVDSLISVKQRLTALFPDAEKYHIAYMLNGDVWLMYEDGTGRKRISHSGKVISFTADAASLYFGEPSGTDLNVFVYRFNESGGVQKLLTLAGESEKYFEAGEVASGGRMTLTSEGKLCIAANFFWESAGFLNTYHVDLGNLGVEFLEEAECRFGAQIEFKSTADKGGAFLSKKAGKEYELFFVNPKKQLIQLSHTQKYSPRTCYDEPVTDFDYAVLKTGKVLYSFVYECGDLSHSALSVVNPDGTHGVVISEDFKTNGADLGILRSNGSVVILRSDGETDGYNLVAFPGNTNEPYVLSRGITGFLMIP